MKNVLRRIIEAMRGEYIVPAPECTSYIGDFADCRRIASERRITSLTVTNAEPLSDAEISELSQVTTIESLTCARWQLTARNLTQLGKLTKLSELYVRAGASGEVGDAIGTLASLRRLKWYFEQDASVGRDVLRGLSGLENLRDLHLEGGVLASDALVDLSGAHLEALRIDAEFSPEVLRTLPAFSELRRLSVRQVQRTLTDADVAVLSQCARLGQLSVSGAWIQGAGLQALLCLPELTSLSLTGAQVDDSALDAVESWPRQLKVLMVLSTNVTATGCSRLQARIPHCKVIGPSAEDATPALPSLRGPVSSEPIRYVIRDETLTIGGKTWTFLGPIEQAIAFDDVVVVRIAPDPGYASLGLSGNVHAIDRHGQFAWGLLGPPTRDRSDCYLDMFKEGNELALESATGKTFVVDPHSGVFLQKDAEQLAIEQERSENLSAQIRTFAELATQLRNELPRDMRSE